MSASGAGRDADGGTGATADPTTTAKTSSETTEERVTTDESMTTSERETRAHGGATAQRDATADAPRADRLGDSPAIFPGPPTGLEIIALWTLFAIVMTLLSLENLHSGSNPFGDVYEVYRGWANQAAGGSVPGIHEPFVYPILALVPMWLARVLGGPEREGYGTAWLWIVIAASAIGLAWLTIRPHLAAGRASDPARAAGSASLERAERRGADAGWWWLAYLIALGPIAIGRIDGFTAPLAIIGIMLVRSSPLLSGALLALLAWCKIWTVAPFAAAVALFTRQRGMLLVGGLAVTAVVILVGLMAGSGANVLSFVTEQTGRGLQVESTAATPFTWLAAAQTPGYQVAYDTDILSVQVSGPGTEIASSLTTPAMALGIGALLAIAMLSHRRGARPERLVLPLALGLVLVLILFNKVGSPQFATWIGAVMAAAIAIEGRRWLLPGGLALVAAWATQLIYPWSYDRVMYMSTTGAALLTVRNGLYVALFVWCVRELLRRAKAGGEEAAVAEVDGVDEEAPEEAPIEDGAIAEPAAEAEPALEAASASEPASTA